MEQFELITVKLPFRVSGFICGVAGNAGMGVYCENSQGAWFHLLCCLESRHWGAQKPDLSELFPMEGRLGTEGSVHNSDTMDLHYFHRFWVQPGLF